MSAAYDLTELVNLSRTLGEPWRRFVILAEGNTSQRVSEDQLVVKATGRSLHNASAEDFVVVSLRRLSDLVDDVDAGDADVALYFDEHVEADAVHEQIAGRDLAGGLAEASPELVPDIVFGTVKIALPASVFQMRSRAELPR